MKIIGQKIIKSNPFVAFLLVFSPIIISLAFFFIGMRLNIPQLLASSTGGIFFPYLQIIVLISWIEYPVIHINKKYNLNSEYVNKYRKFVKISKIILVILIFTVFFNSILPRYIEYSSIINTIITLISYVAMIAQLFLFFTYFYGMWIISEIVNKAKEKEGKTQDMNIVLFLFLPFTFGLIHKRINEVI